MQSAGKKVTMNGQTFFSDAGGNQNGAKRRANTKSMFNHLVGKNATSNDCNTGLDLQVSNSFSKKSTIISLNGIINEMNAIKMNAALNPGLINSCNLSRDIFVS